MTLPPKALSVLVDIKKELLYRATVLSVPSRPSVMITRKPTQIMRHARVRGFAVQRMYQRGEM